MRRFKDTGTLAICSALIGLTALCVTARRAYALGDANEVWVSARTNAAGQGWMLGTGAMTDPFYGDLNKIVRSLTTNTTIHLLPGTHYNSNDLVLAAGQRVLGAGIDITTVRRIVNKSGYMFFTRRPGVEICDLTVDAGGNSSNKWANHGVCLEAGNSAVRRVKVLNVSGNYAGKHEAWAISVGAAGDKIGCVVSDCIATNFQGDYNDGICLAGRGMVEDNYVFGSNQGAYGSYWTENAVFTHNLAESCGNGFYTDTGWETNLTIAGNTFKNVTNGIWISKARTNGFVVVGLTIKDNTIELSPNVGKWAWAINLENNEKTHVPWQRISVIGNTLHYFNDVNINSKGVVDVGGTVLLTNIVSVLVANNFIDSTFVISGIKPTFANNMGLDGVPLGVRVIATGSPGRVALASITYTVFITSATTTNVVLAKCDYAANNGFVAPNAGNEVILVNEKAVGNVIVTPSRGDTLLPTSSCTIAAGHSAKFICDGTSTWAKE
jgi:hypothetical protein